MRQVEAAERTSSKIAAARASYTPVARRAATLYFVVSEHSGVDPMYQVRIGTDRHGR
jgi:hypothetical protein